MHWYNEAGEPAYEILGANGKLRATTLADARKHKYVPSVTTILQIPAKPALDVWKTNQVLEAVLTCDSNPSAFSTPEQIKAWKSFIIKASQEIGKKTAKRGGELHDQLEKYFTGEKHIGEYGEDQKFVLPAIEAVDSILKSKTWIAEKSFSHSLGFGGRVDLHTKKLPGGVVLDFKTKSGSANFEKDLGYREHAMQLAAYRIGLDLPEAKCYNLFISTETPGLVQLKEWTEEEVQRGWEMFKCLLRYWQLEKNLYV